MRSLRETGGFFATQRREHGPKHCALPEGESNATRRELISKEIALLRVRERRSGESLKSWLDAPDLLPEAASTFLSDKPSGQGKAGALWETAFPLLPPLPSPRTTPSF